MGTVVVKGVSKRFGSVHALQDITMHIADGEFVSIIGRSGCGKTTLLKIVANLVKESEGEVLIDGLHPQEAVKAHKIGFAFQQSALLPWLTALENVALTLSITGVREGNLDPQRLLQQFGLGGFEHRYPHELSGGMQQRVNIATAVVHNPSVLPMDEPFGALDELTRMAMAEWLGAVLLDSPKTVLFVTHNVEEAVLLSDRVVILAAQPGRIAFEVPVCFERPRTQSLLTESAFVEKVTEVRKLLYSVAQIDATNS